MNVSRKESEVEDNGKTVVSQMGRLDFMYRRLPSFLKLKVDNPFLSFKVPATSSLIKGESANPNAGRDFQYTMIFVDEAAHIDCMTGMWKSISNSTNCIVMVSTLGSEDSKYHELRKKMKALEALGQKAPMKVVRIHWKDNPRKDIGWYARKTANLDEEDIAREIDISDDKPKILKIYPEFDDTFHVSQYEIQLNPKAQLYLAFDFGLDDPEAVLFIQTGFVGRSRCCYILDEYQRGGLLTPEHMINIQRHIIDLKYQGTLGQIIAYGDPAGKQKERTSGTSVVAEYESFGLHIFVKADPGFTLRYRNVKTLLKGKNDESGPRLIINPSCKDVIRSFLNYQRKKPGDDEPKKSMVNHTMTAFEFFCHNEFPVMEAAAVIAGMDPEDVRKHQFMSDFSMRPRTNMFRKI